MKKLYFVTIFIIILIVSYLGITYSFEYNSDNILEFNLIGPKVLYVDVGNEYEEYGVKVFNGKLDISNNVVIDNNVDTSKLGEYYVKYSVNSNNNLEYIYRKVIVIDKISPVIKLKGDIETYILRGGEYIDSGYTVSDNYDTDLEDKVKVTGSVDVNKVGTYEITYSVQDSSFNKTEVIRKVIVKEPVNSLADMTGNEIVDYKFNYLKYDNTIISNKWNNDGVYIEGYDKTNYNNYKIMFKNSNNKQTYLFNMTKYKDNLYRGNLDLSTVNNGEYDLYIVSNEEKRLYNRLDGMSRIIRAKVGNKLITFKYINDMVSLVIEDFKYEYDIVIDPGHGGSDYGAGNGIMFEKYLNLMVSKYEKCRYESMGYKVFMTRYDDTYGKLMGDTSLSNLVRRSLTIGYYGTVSRVVYSNHHNSSNNKNVSGFEIIVSNSLSNDKLFVNESLYNKYMDYYKLKDNNKRLYSRDYWSGTIYNKLDGKVNDKIDYYAIIRTPLSLFNVNTTIYEPIYLSNSRDYNFYYVNNNWINISEIKIQEYVNYLGGIYNSDNSMCL